MSTSYPGTIQTFTNPSGTSLLTSPDHAGLHSDVNDTLGAIQNTLGTTAGTALFNAFGASDKPEKKGVITMGTTAYTTSGTLAANQVLKYDGTTIIGGVAGATSPLTTKGDLYVYSTEGTRLPVGTADGYVLKVNGTTATGLEWGVASSAGTNSFIVNETPSGTPNGTLTAFTLANTPVTNTEMIFRDGQLLAGGTADYFMSAGTINFVTAPVTNSVIRASYQLAGASSGNADTVDNYHANATPTAGAIPVLDSAMAMIGGGMSRQSVQNGNFDVWQRGTSSTIADVTSVYLADRWVDYTTKNGGTLPTLTRSRQAFSAGELENSYYFTRLNSNGAGTSLGVNSWHAYREKIENGVRYLCGNGKKVTVSFYARSSIANKQLGIGLWQNYGSGGSPSSEEYIGTQITLSSTLTRYTYTFTTNTLSGKTFGTANDDSLALVFYYMWGDTIGDTFGLTGAETYVGSGDTDIAQVQLCAGDVALPFQPKSYAQELADCQRYLFRISSSSGSTYTRYGTGQATSASAGGGIIYFPVKMRTIPTFSIGGNYGITANNGAVIAGTAASVPTNGDSLELSYVDVTVAGGLTAGNSCIFLANNDATGYVQFDAEL